MLTISKVKNMTTNILIEKPLVSNGYTLSGVPERLGWLEPTDLNLPISRLREQFEAQGYLWLKGLLDRQEVLAFRRRYFAAFAGTGLLAPGSDPLEGIYSGGGEDKEATHRLMLEVVRWAAYEAFCLSAPIIKFYEDFLQEPVYLHKRKLIRYNRPRDPKCTGGHYDLTYLRGGTDRLCSSWLPLGDVPVEMGGLIYLEGSAAVGRQLEAEYLQQTATLPYEKRISAYNFGSKSGWLGEDLPAIAEKYGGRWLVGNYEAGDMLIHGPYTIHASTENCDKQGRMRLSTDIRYQRVRDEIDRRWTKDWQPDDGL